MNNKKCILTSKLIISMFMMLLMMLVFTPRVEARCTCGAKNYGYPNECRTCGLYTGTGACYGCGGTDTRQACSHRSCGCCGQPNCYTSSHSSKWCVKANCSCSTYTCTAAHCGKTACYSCGHACDGDCSYDTYCCEKGKKCGICGAKDHASCHSCDFSIYCCASGYKCSCGIKSHNPCHEHSYTLDCCDAGKKCSCGVKNHTTCHNHSYSYDCCYYGNKCSCGDKNHDPCHTHNYTIPCCVTGNKCNECGAKNHTTCHHHSYTLACCDRGNKCSCNAKDHTTCHNHNYVMQDNASEHWEKCSGCTAERNRAAHTGGTKYCLVGKICTTCSREYTESLGHSMVWCCDAGNVCSRSTCTPYRDHNPCHNHTYVIKDDATNHWDECTGCGHKKNTESHYGGTKYCTVGKICTECNREYTGTLGHQWSETYTKTSTDHYKECIRVINGIACDATTAWGAHSDSNPLNGRCDTCDYITDKINPVMTCDSNSTYKKSHTATVSFKDEGGAFLSSGTYTIEYAWTTTTSTPSSYPSSTTLSVGSGVRTASKEITKSDGTGTYYLHVRVSSNFKDSVGNPGNSTAGGASSLFNFDNTAPTIEIDSDTTYEKSQTATITFKDVGGAHLSADTYKLEYAWTTSTTAPSTFSHSTTTTVESGKDTHTTTITKSDGTGIYYLHVKLSKPVTDTAGNYSTTTLRGTFYLDNTAPTIEITPLSAYTPMSIRDSRVIEFIVTDKHIGIDTNEFTAEDIIAYVAGNTSAGQKRLEYVSVDNGEYRYKLTLSNVPETGNVSFRVVANAVADKLGNSSAQTDFAENQTNLFADNSIPNVSLNGKIEVINITEGKNYSNTFDPRYINKEYTIEIPILVKDVSGLDLTNGFDAEDVQMYVDSSLVEVEKEARLVKEYAKADTATGLVEFYKEYILTVSGLTSDGYLSMKVIQGAIKDSAQNTNTLTELKPYTVHNGSTEYIYVDNTMPRIMIEDVVANRVMDKKMSATIRLYVKELGAGIRDGEFTADDIIVQIDGKTITSVEKTLIPSVNNDYDTELGGDVSANYRYDLVLSGLEETGDLRLEIPANKIVDKANNGNEIITLESQINIDNEGPKLGRISSNADEQGEVIGVPIIVTIIDCVDESGIEKYVWERSKNQTDWEEIKVDNSALSTSMVEQEYKDDNSYYYRVIVSDTLGNVSTSDVIRVDYRNSIDGKPTVRLSQTQVSNEKVDINVIIKSKFPIQKVVVNGSELAKSKYENNVSQNNYEYTTTLTHTVAKNGVYEFTVTDERGNIATDSINISIIDSTDAVITYEKFDVTFASPAKIIFTSNEPVRIIDSNGYSGITFLETNFATRIEATISSGEKFDEDRTFIFENKGLLPTEVLVKAPIITKLGYVRFTGHSSDNLELTLKEIGALVSGMPLSKRMSTSGIIKSYYGFKGDDINVKIATRKALSLAETLGSVNETFVIDENGQKVTLQEEQGLTVNEGSSYINGNVSGMYKKTEKLLINFDGIINEGATKHGTFRIILVP